MNSQRIRKQAKIRKAYEKIIPALYPDDLPLMITTDLSSSVNLNYEYKPNSTIVLKAKPNFLTMSDNKDGWVYLFDYLSVEQQEIWKNYSGHLFCLLHEIGHIFTYCGLNPDIQRQKVLNIQIKCKTQEELCLKYRKITREARADKWATKWVIDHPELAEIWSRELELAYS